MSGIQHFVNGANLTITFFVLVGVIFIVGVVNLVFCALNLFNACKKRLWYLVLVFGVSLVLLSVIVLGVKGVSSLKLFAYPLALFGEGITLFSITLIFSGNTYTIKIKEEEKPKIDAIEFMKNNKVAERILQRINTTPEVPPATFSTLKENKNTEPCNFSHVKNVLKRMDYYNLSITDRKQVENLKLLVIKAETEELTDELQLELNEGLNGLLKIMSKYKV